MRSPSAAPLPRPRPAGCCGRSSGSRNPSGRSKKGRARRLWHCPGRAGWLAWVGVCHCCLSHPHKHPVPCAYPPAADIAPFPHPEPRDRVTHVRVTPARHSRELCRDRLSLFPVPPVQASAVVLWTPTEPKVPFHTFSFRFTVLRSVELLGEKPGKRKPSYYSSGQHCFVSRRLRDSGKETCTVIENLVSPIPSALRSGWFQ